MVQQQQVVDQMVQQQQVVDQMVQQQQVVDQMTYYPHDTNNYGMFDQPIDPQHQNHIASYPQQPYSMINEDQTKLYNDQNLPLNSYCSSADQSACCYDYGGNPNYFTNNSQYAEGDQCLRPTFADTNPRMNCVFNPVQID